jgi:hypothetical protein
MGKAFLGLENDLHKDVTVSKQQKGKREKLKKKRFIVCANTIVTN